MRDRGLIVFRVVMAALTLAAIATQFLKGLQRDSFSPVNFFSFFTIESNLFAAIVFLAGALLVFRRRVPPWFGLARGAAFMYMVTTGTVYVLLLAGLEESLQTATPWVNAVLHYLMPVAAIADWVIDRPQRPIQFRTATVWMVFPVTYLAYSLLRGPIVDWYPYPFLNPDSEDTGGYAGVAAYSVVITLGFFGLVWLVSRTSATKQPG